MIFCIRHSTEFHYESTAYESHNELRLRPIESCIERVLSFELSVSPPGTMFEFNDYFGNRVHCVSIHPPHDRLSIVSDSTVERLPCPERRPPAIAFERYLADDEARTREYCEFLSATGYVPFSDRLRKFFWMVRPGGSEDLTEYVMRILGFIRDQFGYDTASTNVHSTLDEILRAGGGVCQDFAHLTLGVLRLAGIPARYVSGYLAPEPGIETPPGSQASHAWVEAMLPGAGWTGFDPTHRCRTDLRYIRVAVGRDYADATPVRGVYRSLGGHNTMTVDLEISPAQLNEQAAQSQQ
jgi:transglutaminase-like putative cysteine protease